MMIESSFALNYLLLVFGGAVGVVQIAAAHAGLKGLRFFQSRGLGYFFGFLILTATYIWFFSTADLRSPHPEVEGAQQFGLFLLGAFCAITFSFLVSSLNSSRQVKAEGQMPEGLESLRELTLLQIIHRLRRKNR